MKKKTMTDPKQEIANGQLHESFEIIVYLGTCMALMWQKYHVDQSLFLSL